VALSQRPLRSPALRLVEAKIASAPPQVSDAELVLLCLAEKGRAAPGGAFEELYRRHAAAVLALAVRIQGSAADVEDIVHDAFVRAHDHLHTLENGSAFRAWLGSIVVRLVRTRLRRRRFLYRLGLTESEAIDLEAIVQPGAEPEHRLELAEVYGVLSKLDIDKRIAWTLRYVEGHKLEEVAVLTACSLATAKRRILAVQDALWLRLGPGGLRVPLGEGEGEAHG
jgi:RNA polymerase sigma-70 factor, ECF subfamily